MRTAHSLLRLVSILLDLAQDALQFLLLGTRSSAALKAENIFLRKQLALYLEREAKPRRATDATRLSMVLLSRLFAWQNALINVKPETFLGWHRKGFQLLWRWKSRLGGRPRVPRQLRELICKMASQKQTWGEELRSAKMPSGGFKRNVTLLHSDRLPSEALCCGKIPSYFEAVTGKLEARLRNDFWE